MSPNESGGWVLQKPRQAIQVYMRPGSILVGGAHEISGLGINRDQALENKRKFAEQLLVAWSVFSNRPGYPGIIQIMFERDIFIGDITRPDTAAHA